MVWTEAPARAKVAGHPLLPIPTATASLPDSTRDLKPANVKVKADGTVKVLDFGLAKACQPEASGASASESPTISLTAAGTQMGMVLGTAAYMSPEQAKGKPVDRRADVWAFGVVFFEMLTGRKVFVGDDVSETLVSVFRDEPDWSALPGEVTNSTKQALQICLHKDAKRRAGDMSAVRLAMEGAFVATGGGLAGPVVAPSLAVWQRPVVIVVALVAALGLGGLVVWSLMRPGPPSPAPVARFSIPLGAGQTFTSAGRNLVALSPDGTMLVYRADRQLYLRRLDQWQATSIAGTEGGASNPFISPDGEWIGFWADGQLKRVATSGGAAVTLCDAAPPYGATWGDDNMILFGGGDGDVWRVPGSGGTPELVIDVEEG